MDSIIHHFCQKLLIQSQHFYQIAMLLYSVDSQKERKEKLLFNLIILLEFILCKCLDVTKYVTIATTIDDLLSFFKKTLNGGTTISMLFN